MGIKGEIRVEWDRREEKLQLICKINKLEKKTQIKLFQYAINRVIEVILWAVGMITIVDIDQQD